MKSMTLLRKAFLSVDLSNKLLSYFSPDKHFLNLWVAGDTVAVERQEKNKFSITDGVVIIFIVRSRIESLGFVHE